MRQEFVQKLRLATKLMNLILECTEQGEDYSLLMRQYNDLIDEYYLPLPRMVYVSNVRVEFC